MRSTTTITFVCTNISNFYTMWWLIKMGFKVLPNVLPNFCFSYWLNAGIKFVDKMRFVDKMIPLASGTNW